MKIRSLLLALAALFALSLPARAGDAGPVWCTQAVSYDSAAIQTLKVITGTTGDSVYICGWDSNNTATGTFQLVSGTGANCVTNQAVLTPVWTFPASGSFVVDGAIWKGIKVDKNIDVCVKTTIAVGTQLQIHYNQK